MRALLFDLDGTLVDTAPDFHRLLTTMAQARQVRPPDFTSTRRQVSTGASAMAMLIAHAQGFCHPDEFTTHANLLAYVQKNPAIVALRDELLDLYSADVCQDSRIFAGLEWVRDVDKLAIVTNKPRALAQDLLAKLHIKSVLICPEDVAQAKPNPEGLLKACTQLNIAPQNALYAGDHKRDIDAANACGMSSVACGFGYCDGADAQQWGATFYAETPQILTQICHDFLDNK